VASVTDSDKRILLSHEMNFLRTIDYNLYIYDDIKSFESLYNDYLQLKRTNIWSTINRIVRKYIKFTSSKYHWVVFRNDFYISNSRNVFGNLQGL
jgi:hypothetical protein